MNFRAFKIAKSELVSFTVNDREFSNSKREQEERKVHRNGAIDWMNNTNSSRWETSQKTLNYISFASR